MSINSKTEVAFFETEKWEQDYLREKLQGDSNLSLNFFAKPINSAIVAKISNTQVLAVFIYSMVNEKTIAKFPNLKFIATMSTGFDHIDLDFCKKQGIKVSNVPFYGDNTVAEHTFSLILAFARKLPESIERTKKADFSLAGLRGFDLKGKTIGIIGLGHIGIWVAKIAKSFGMDILAFDPIQDLNLSQELGVQYTDLDFLLANSDIITLHAPYNEKTRHLINKNNILKIKKGAYLINTARGGLVETEALLLALKKNILNGVGLDVLEEECFIKEEKELITKKFQKTCDLRTVLQNHLLVNDPRVLITPHNAFNSKESLARILDTTSGNIKSFLQGKPENLVN